MSYLRIVATFLKRDEAEIAKGFLETKGIHGIICGDDCGGTRPNMSLGSNIALSVQEDDLQEAKKLLANL